jgi:DNA repair photolyase
MLGELYKPKGLALETARAVLEVDAPYACNVALGCSNQCTYCYVPKITKTKEMRQPKNSISELVKAQLKKGLYPQGVFLSFLTDPFHYKNRENTENLIHFLHEWDWMMPIATLSKLGISENENLNMRNGISIVSLDKEFQRKYEPNTLAPKNRLKALLITHLKGYAWASLEPYPVSAIYKQNFMPLLEELKFFDVDLIVFGKWNYDKRASTPQARQEYSQNIDTLRDFCKSNNIRLHIKSDTLKFVANGVDGKIGFEARG